MGWTTDIELPTGATLKGEIDRMLTFEQGERRSAVLASSIVSSTYYAAVEAHGANGYHAIFAAVILTSTSNTRYGGRSWGYKDMDENMGPYRYGCPARILDLLTTTDNDSANKWRASCREVLARRSKCKTLKAGMVIKLHHPMKFTDGAEIDTFKVVERLFKPGLVFDHGGRLYKPCRSALVATGYDVISAVG